MSADELADRIRARLQATGAEMVILPMRTDERSGKAVYSNDQLFLVKRLKRAGIPAEFLDESEDRAFESQYSAEPAILGAIAVGLATSAAYDVLKAAVLRLWPGNDREITVAVTDSTETTPAKVAITGKPIDVLDMLEQLKAREMLPRDLPPTPSRLPLRHERALRTADDRDNRAIDERLAEADRLVADAKGLLETGLAGPVEAEAAAVGALAVVPRQVVNT